MSTSEVEKIRAEVERRYNEKDRLGDDIRANVYKSILRFIDYMQEEPVTSDFETALAKEWKGYNDRGAATVDALEDNTQELAFAKGFYRGWNYPKEKPVSEELEKEIDSYFAKWLQGSSDEGCFNPDSQLVSIYDCHRIARHFANWQKQKNKSKVLTEEQCRKIRDDAFELGKDAMKQQMMKEAVKVNISNASIVFLPVNCNLKVGDKVLIIKEE